MLDAAGLRTQGLVAVGCAGTLSLDSSQLPLIEVHNAAERVGQLKERSPGTALVLPIAPSPIGPLNVLVFVLRKDIHTFGLNTRVEIILGFKG